ncbi:unnamed protein product [Camellia sinensis]
MSSNNNGGGLQSIPAASRKMVQSLKEIVNCPELEIYAMLKDCNMDPNEAENRLLSQENKEITESRFRGFGNSSSRGGRGGTDRYVGRAGSTQFSSSESGVLLGKSSDNKENGTNNYTSASSLAFEMAGNNTNRRSPADSDLITIENEVMTIDTLDGIQLSSGYQPVWSGVPGQVSMADIVKMGRPHSKGSSTTNPSQYANNHLHAEALRSNASHNNLHSSEVYLSVLEINPEPGVGTLSPNDEGPLIEQLPAAGAPPVLEPPVTSELYVDASHLSSDKIQHSQFQKDDVRAVEDIAIENINANQTGSASVSIMKIEEDNSGGASLFNDDICKNMGSYQPHTNSFELREGGAQAFDEKFSASAPWLIQGVKSEDVDKEAVFECCEVLYCGPSDESLQYEILLCLENVCHLHQTLDCFAVVLMLMEMLSDAIVYAAAYPIGATTCWVDNWEFGLLYLSYKWLSSADGCWMHLVVYKLSSFILLSFFMVFLTYIAQYFVKPTLVGCTRSFVDMSRPHAITLVSGLHMIDFYVPRCLRLYSVGLVAAGLRF